MTLREGRLPNIEELAQVMYEGYRSQKSSARAMHLKCAEDISSCHAEDAPPEPPSWDDLGIGERTAWFGAANAVRKIGILKE